MPSSKQLHQRDCQNHSQDSVKGSSPGSGIKMGPDEEARHSRLSSGVACPNVAGWIDVNAHTGFLHPAAEPRVNFVHRRREKSARGKAGFLCKFGKLPAAADDFVSKREWRRQCAGGGVPIEENVVLGVG